MIWRRFFPSALSPVPAGFALRPPVSKGHFLSWLYPVNKFTGFLYVKLSNEDKAIIIALQISGDSRRAAPPVYRCLVTCGRTIYFYPDRDSLRSTGLETLYQMNRPASIEQLIMNTWMWSWRASVYRFVYERRVVRAGSQKILVYLEGATTQQKSTSWLRGKSRYVP
jgi:hypothetical protein